MRKNYKISPNIVIKTDGEYCSDNCPYFNYSYNMCNLFVFCVSTIKYPLKITHGNAIRCKPCLKYTAQMEQGE
jgi:hypothetical protein